jgi:hypothetical protein
MLARQIAEFILEKSMGGHFGYFKLVLDLVDGTLHRTAEDEMTFAPDCVLVVADDSRDATMAKAAWRHPYVVIPFTGARQCYPFHTSGHHLGREAIAKIRPTFAHT